MLYTRRYVICWEFKFPSFKRAWGGTKKGMTTPPELVAAVSNAGGLGCIGGSSIRPEVIRERIRAVRQLTDKPFGVDITLPKMEDVKIPDPDEVHKEIEEKFPKHAKFNDELIPKLGLDAAAAGSKELGENASGDARAVESHSRRESADFDHRSRRHRRGRAAGARDRHQSHGARRRGEACAQPCAQRRRRDHRARLRSRRAHGNHRQLSVDSADRRRGETETGGRRRRYQRWPRRRGGSGLGRGGCLVRHYVSW